MLLMILSGAIRRSCHHGCRRMLSSTASFPDAGLRSADDAGAEECDPICELASSSIRFGAGATAEVGDDLREMGARSTLVFTDRNVKQLPCMSTLLESLDRNRLDVALYDAVRVEPNDASFKDAINFASSREYDAVVAIGGGSVMDTAKAANLYAALPPPENDFYHYVNAPVGRGMPVPVDAKTNPLPPLIAIPTTAGTGSETTGVAIFDDVATKSKTGIASRRIRPYLGVVDPDNTATLPHHVAACSGLDVLCHAIESYTALPSTQRPKPASPALRPAYQGSNPISDVWSLQALRTAASLIRRAVADPTDCDARSGMLLAAAFAGIGFGNAGVHLCHGMSYPTASQVRTYRPPRGSGYDLAADDDHHLVPHGHSVIVNAPAVFRFTGVSDPERHALCADILAEARQGSGRRGKVAGRDVASYRSRSAGRLGDEKIGHRLADEILDLMHDLGVPVGLRALGYNESDVDSLVEGTLPQHRVTKISPRPVGREELRTLFVDALDN